MATNDPTSHAELSAIRAASQALCTSNLSCFEVFDSGQPCPMCIAAMRMAGITRVRYAYSNEDAEPFGLSTAAIYTDLAKPFADQSMDIQHAPISFEPDIYRAWIDAQQG